MITLFSGETADEVWKKAASVIVSDKKVETHSSRSGNVREILHSCFSISNPRQRWITSRNPAMNPAFALAEVIWIMNGSNDAEILNHWNPKLPKFAGYDKAYHGAYGYRLRKHFNIDQLEKTYLALRNTPDSRQVVLQIWDTNIDFPDNDGKPVSKDIPCNIISLLKVKKNKLEWMQIIRSNDIFLGVPHNFVQFTSLQEILAGWLELELGSYNQISDSLHLYEHDAEKFQISETKTIQNNDNLSVSKELSDKYFKVIFDKMHKFADKNITQTQFIKETELRYDNTSYQNMLLVIAADAARRKKWLDISVELMHKCSNPILSYLWSRWDERKKKK
jgi:thymidylate synthase